MEVGGQQLGHQSLHNVAPRQQHQAEQNLQSCDVGQLNFIRAHPAVSKGGHKQQQHKHALQAARHRFLQSVSALLTKGI